MECLHVPGQVAFLFKRLPTGQAGEEGGSAGVDSFDVDVEVAFMLKNFSAAGMLAREGGRGNRVGGLHVGGEVPFALEAFTTESTGSDGMLGFYVGA